MCVVAAGHSRSGEGDCAHGQGALGGLGGYGREARPATLSGAGCGWLARVRGGGRGEGGRGGAVAADHQVAPCSCM